MRDTRVYGAYMVRAGRALRRGPGCQVGSMTCSLRATTPPPGHCRGIDGPGIDGPGIDGPGIDGPGIDGPGIDGPGVDGPGIGGPGVESAPVRAREAVLGEATAWRATSEILTKVLPQLSKRFDSTRC